MAGPPSAPPVDTAQRMFDWCETATSLVQFVPRLATAERTWLQGVWDGVVLQHPHLPRYPIFSEIDSTDVPRVWPTQHPPTRVVLRRLSVSSKTKDVGRGYSACGLMVTWMISVTLENVTAYQSPPNNETLVASVAYLQIRLIGPTSTTLVYTTADESSLKSVETTPCSFTLHKPAGTVQDFFAYYAGGACTLTVNSDRPSTQSFLVARARKMFRTASVSFRPDAYPLKGSNHDKCEPGEILFILFFLY